MSLQSIMHQLTEIRSEKYSKKYTWREKRKEKIERKRKKKVYEDTGSNGRYFGAQQLTTLWELH